MAYTLIQDVRWPGVARALSFRYTCSYSRSAGTALLVTAPQRPDEIAPARFGDLIFTDGRTPVILRDCMAEAIDPTYDSEGVTYAIRIRDRRWRWGNEYGGFGGLKGRYNRQDERGKLVPWSIRSPTELARLCLKALGEHGAVIDLPPGLTRAAGANLDRFLRQGENFKQTNTNPETVWDRTPPAEALARLCDLYGRVIVYQPFTNRILVAPLGVGADLPADGVEMDAAQVSKTAAPKYVGVSGAAVGIDARFLTEPVGPEWDGSVLPIDQLSYAPPLSAGKRGRAGVSWAAPAAWEEGDAVSRLALTITWEDPAGVKHTVSVSSTDPDADLDARWADVLAKLAAKPQFAANFTAGVVDGVLEIQHKKAGIDFDVAADLFDPTDPGYYSVKTLDKASNGGKGWRACPPPFRSVVPTDRLSYLEAQQHAQEGVFKWFRLTLRNPSLDSDEIGRAFKLPWFGEVKRVQQLVPRPTRFAQVEPQPRYAGGVNRGSPIVGGPGEIVNQGVLPEFYNGYSRNAAPIAYGSVWKRIGNVLWQKPLPGEPVDHNTKPTDRVFVPFTIEQHPSGDILVKFSEAVFKYDPSYGAAYLAYPEIVVETGVYVTDDETDQVVRYELTQRVPGGEAETEWHDHDDCAVAVIGTYTDSHRSTGWRYGTGDKEHADSAAKHYLAGHARKYVLKEGRNRQYVGFRRINPDGAIQQVTYILGADGSGPTTLASRNNEHSPVVLRYPQRRFREALPPNELAAAANLSEAARIAKIFPAR